MKKATLLLRAFGTLLTLALLAACGGASGSFAGSQQSAALPASARPDRSHAWMSPDAKKRELLYLSSVLTDDVYVYTLPGAKLSGTLTGFQLPYGLCSDKKGNVWIVNDGAADIVEYAHGGTSPIATLSDPGVYPYGCSVDPMTGNLAVTNAYTTGSGAGSVSIYAGAKGTPTTYADPAIFYFRFCGYDDKGNLFVDGWNPTETQVELAELHKGKTTFRSIALNESIENPGGVQWDGEYIAVGDVDKSVIYQTSGDKVVGTTTLGGANFVNQFWVAPGTKDHPQGTKVVAPSQDGGAAGIYAYPVGGEPAKTIEVSEPFGATISKAR
jgi:DNA-binding beta-propeller fold protein YncE